MKAKYILIPCVLWISAFVFHSCDDSVDDSALYTFTGETVASFCRTQPDLTTFYQIIEDAGYKSLLSVYGHFTCFAPTNEAFEAYFTEEGISYESLTQADKINIVNDHIIKGISEAYMSEDFEEGSLPLPNMNDRILLISFTNENNKQVILVNKDSPIDSRDNEVHNGVVHTVLKVVTPSQEDLLSTMRAAGYFTLFSEAFELTQLHTLVADLYDESYKDPYPGVDFVNVVGYDNIAVVHQKKLGYTIFAETDEVFQKAGIRDLNGLIEYATQYYGTEDIDDYTSRNNPLNKFISYHMLDRQMPTNNMIYWGGNTASYAMDKRHEYYETMLHLRLVEVMAGNKINTRLDGSYVGVEEALSNLDAINGYVHALTDVLVYDEEVMVNDVLNKRLRIDAYAIPSELTNNNIRWKNESQSYTITPDFCGDSFTFNSATKIIMWATRGWDDYQGDEISLRGWYDFTLRLPPVPPGSYEIRFGYNAVPWRGVAQLFIDGEIVGIPIDLSINGEDPRVGWVADSQTQDDGVENDKMMRNRGYMKSGNSIINEGYGNLLRNSPNDLRVIVGTFIFEDYDYHYFRAKNVESENGEFHLDFIEYVPVSHLDVEDRD